MAAKIKTATFWGLSVLPVEVEVDRIDLFVEVPQVPIEKLIQKKRNEKPLVLRDLVRAARLRQKERLKGTPFITNNEISQRLLKRYCILGEQAHAFLGQAARKMNLSARSYYRIVKVSRTIADLDGASKVRATHVAEAPQYRKQDETIFC